MKKRPLTSSDDFFSLERTSKPKKIKILQNGLIEAQPSKKRSRFASVVDVSFFFKNDKIEDKTSFTEKEPLRVNFRSSNPRYPQTKRRQIFKTLFQAQQFANQKALQKTPGFMYLPDLLVREDIVEGFRRFFNTQELKAKDSDIAFKVNLIRCISFFHRHCFNELLGEQYKVTTFAARRAFLRVARSLAEDVYEIVVTEIGSNSIVLEELKNIAELQINHFNDEKNYYSASISKKYANINVENLLKHSIVEIIDNYLIELESIFEDRGNMSMFLRDLQCFVQESVKGLNESALVLTQDAKYPPSSCHPQVDNTSPSCQI